MDELRTALAAVADVFVTTIFGEIALAQAIHSGDLEIWSSGEAKLHELGQRVTDLVVEDDRFPQDGRLELRLPHGNMVVYPEGSGVLLVRRTIDYGSPDDAIEWLLRVLQTKCTSGRMIEALWGVPVKEEFGSVQNFV